MSVPLEQEKLRKTLFTTPATRELLGIDREEDLTFAAIPDHAMNLVVTTLDGKFFVKVGEEPNLSVEEGFYRAMKEIEEPAPDLAVAPYDGTEKPHLVLVTSRLEGTSFAQEIKDTPMDERSILFDEMSNTAARHSVKLTKLLRENPGKYKTTWGNFSDPIEAKFGKKRLFGAYNLNPENEDRYPSLKEAFAKSIDELASVDPKLELVYTDEVASNYLRRPDGNLLRVDLEKTSSGRHPGFIAVAIYDTPVTTVDLAPKLEIAHIKNFGDYIGGYAREVNLDTDLRHLESGEFIDAFYLASIAKGAGAVQSRILHVKNPARAHEREENIAGRDFHYQRVDRAFARLSESKRNDRELWERARKEYESAYKELIARE